MREVLEARFLIGVQIGQEITTGVSITRRPEYELSSDDIGVLITYKGKTTLVPYSNVSYLVLAPARPAVGVAVGAANRVVKP